jgi:hypothetical protein
MLATAGQWEDRLAATVSERRFQVRVAEKPLPRTPLDRGQEEGSGQVARQLVRGEAGSPVPARRQQDHSAGEASEEDRCGKTRTIIKDGAGYLTNDVPGCPNKGGLLSEAHLLRTDLSEAELMSANLDGANARVAARAGRVNPSAPAGHSLQLPVRELAAFFSERRGTGKHQVDGL